MRAMTGLRKILRAAAAFAALICGAFWAWSHHRPLGVGRIDDAFLIVESKHGSLIVSRVDLERGHWVSAAPAGWHFFSANCEVDDLVTLADAWVGRHHLGFAFGVKPSATAADKTWILDENGMPVETTYAESGLPVPPPHKHHQFVLVVPWWGITLCILAASLFVWKRNKPKYAGFPVTPSRS